jgi:hypothetical protein
MIREIREIMVICIQFTEEITRAAAQHEGVKANLPEVFRPLFGRNLREVYLQRRKNE